MSQARVVIFVLAAAVAVSSGSALAQDAAKIEKGKKLYTEQKCQLCHSVEGKGNAKGVLDGMGSKLTADEIKKWLVSPKEMAEKAKATRKPVMKDYSKLPADDIDALTAYVASLKKK